jgi:chromate reductase
MFMADDFTILGIAGSLREGSYNRAALRAAQTLAPAGIRIDIFDLKDLPLFNDDLVARPPHAVVDLKTRVRAAGALLFATPEYNYSVPGVLKNAIDWGSRPYGDSAWEGKAAAVMGAATGAIGTARAQYHLRQMFVFLDVHAVNKPEVMIGHAAQKFDAHGNLTDENTRVRIRELLESLAAWARRLNK